MTPAALALAERQAIQRNQVIGALVRAARECGVEVVRGAVGEWCKLNEKGRDER